MVFGATLGLGTGEPDSRVRMVGSMSPHSEKHRLVTGIIDRLRKFPHQLGTGPHVCVILHHFPRLYHITLTKR
jgi:hypothetical protein